MTRSRQHFKPIAELSDSSLRGNLGSTRRNVEWRAFDVENLMRSHATAGEIAQAERDLRFAWASRDAIVIEAARRGLYTPRRGQP